MASPGDILWPSLGFVAGLNPYLGGGIRTGLTVHEALQRGREADEEERRKREEKDQAEAERRALTDELLGMIPPEDQSQKARYARALAKHDPVNAMKFFKDFFEEEEPEEPVTPYDQLDELLGTIDPNVEGQFPVRTPGGTAQIWHRKPSVKDALGDDGGWEKAGGKPGVYARIRPQPGPWAPGEEPYQVETMTSPEILALNADDPKGAAAKPDDAWMAAQLAYDKAKERLAVLKDKRKRVLTEGVMAGNAQAGFMVAGPGGLDSQIEQAELAFKIAENKLLRALSPPATAGPSPEVWGESPDAPARDYQSGAAMPGQTVSPHQGAVAGANQGSGQHLYFDEQGNLIGGP